MKAKLFFTTLLVIALLALAAGVALAEVNAFGLGWWTVDSGGGRSSAGGFVLNGTIAQPDAGTLSSQAYRLEGGFWEPSQAGAVDTFIYIPAVRR